MSESPSAWPDPTPIPNNLATVERFDDGLLPDSLRPWITDVAERIQCPPDFPAVAAMVVLAGIVGRKISIRPKRFDDWQVVPNLWGAVIGRPSLMKTPAITEPLSMADRLEIEAKESYEAEMIDHEAAALVAHASKDVAKAEVKKAIRAGGDAKAIASRHIAGVSSTPIRRRFRLNDTTIEKLGEILNENPNGVIVFRDELTGFLRSLDRDGQEGARSFYLEAWNGKGRYTYDRIGRGTIDIEAAIVSIVGGIQPGPLGDYLRSAVKGGRGDDGLIQRFQLAVWPDSSHDWKNVDRWPDSKAKQVAWATYRRVAESRLATEMGDGIPYLRFSEMAQERFDSWRAGLEGHLRTADDHPAIEAHLAKYRSLVPSLALLIHVADQSSGDPVSIEALDKSLRWARYLESHARRIYGAVTGRDFDAARALAKKLKDGSLKAEFALRDVYRTGWSYLATHDDAQAAVEILIDLDWLQEYREPTSGRTRITFKVNPKIHASQ